MIPIASTKTLVYIKTQVIGFHRWPSAPEKRGYLADKHRHLFKITVSAATHLSEGDNRPVEYHALLEATNTAITPAPVNFQDMSCEMIARKLGDHLRSKGWPIVAVDVSEDGECGSVVMWEWPDGTYTHIGGEVVGG